jgi:hypothetical protein
MSLQSRRVLFFVGFFITALIFSPIGRFLVDDYLKVGERWGELYRTLATAVIAGTVCGTYAYLARRLLRP